MNPHLRGVTVAATCLAGALLGAPAHGADTGEPRQPTLRRHSIEVSPVSPFIRIYAVQYAYRFTRSDELVVGPAYMNIHYDFGETRAPAIILGYRRYLWRELHLEYQIWPVYDWFWESRERKTYRSFDLWNEARLGYRFAIDVGGLDLFVTPQFAFGFGLYASNKPESFKAAERENRWFYAPLVFTGISF